MKTGVSSTASYTAGQIGVLPANTRRLYIINTPIDDYFACDRHIQVIRPPVTRVGPTGQGPGKNNWTVHVKKSKKTKWQPCVVCSMEAGADG